MKTVTMPFDEYEELAKNSKMVKLLEENDSKLKELRALEEQRSGARIKEIEYRYNPGVITKTHATILYMIITGLILTLILS